jgi:hypothetical protein
VPVRADLHHELAELGRAAGQRPDTFRGKDHRRSQLLTSTASISRPSAARGNGNPASEDVLIEGLPATTDDACYRAMDWLLQVKDPLEKEIFGRVAILLNLEAGRETC